MVEYKDCKFTKVRILLEGSSYTNVVFNECTMVFTGENLSSVSLVGCNFNNCSWHFEGAAGNTVNFINMLAGAMGGIAGEHFIKSLFKKHL